MTLRTLKQAVVAGGAVFSLMYLGGACHLNDAVNGVMGNEDALSVDYKSSGPGEDPVFGGVEGFRGYLEFSDAGLDVELPVFRKKSSLQVGTVDYWWNLLDEDEKTDVAGRSWYFFLSVDKQEKFVADVWDTFGKSAKYPLVKSELESALESFYGGE